MTHLKIALDWTPNINHIGLFVAKALGYYEVEDINLEILSPETDNYTLTPGKKLELDIADFSIAPFETVISLNNKKNIVDAIAVFTILQEDISSIASLKSSLIRTAKDLDNKVYASYKARYEDHIVKQMIKNDGGTGDLNIIYPEKLGIWNTLLEGKADATWIFNNWEGIEAETNQIKLHKLMMSDFEIPYCYSPVILAKHSNVLKHKKHYSNFIKATQKGYLYVAKNIEESAEILKKQLSEKEKTRIDVLKSIDYTIPFFGNASNCGLMKPERVHTFLKWLVTRGLEDEKIIKQQLFTNMLLE